MKAARTTSILIIGTGFGGLGMAIRLKQRGVGEFIVLERSDEVGGTWRDNSYPGCACDVESHLYSFSFAPNPDWTRAFSTQPEIWAYLRGCAERFGVRPHVRFGHEVRGAAWHEESREWVVDTARGEFRARVLVSAAGALSEPMLPSIPGIERFRGKVMHSARWDRGFDLSGRRVAVVGTGASAIQFVPAIQPGVARLHLFQRTPPWVLPRPDRAFSPTWRKALARHPSLQRALRAWIFAMREAMGFAFRHPAILRVLQRVALHHLRRSVADPELRRKLTPAYVIGCKRVLLSNDYYPALARANVELVTEPIREIRQGSVVTSDGREREVDAILLGTGFHVTDMPLARIVRGRGGRTLEETWGGSPRTHLGTTVAGFPNLFLLLGPGTGLGHNSVVLMIESQIEHVLGALRFLRESGTRAIEPRPEAQARFNEELQSRMRRTVWVTGGCRSWYIDRTGVNSALWPASVPAFRRRVSPFDPSEYEPLT